MNSIEGWISESMVIALGWTLLHFLWQGTLVGHPVNGEVGTWLAPSGSQICSPFACPYSRLQ